MGGAEKFTAALGTALQTAGVHAGILFVRRPGRLGDDLRSRGIPYRSLGLRRSLEVFHHPRRFAQAVESFGASGTLLPAVGHLALGLSIGGYAAPIVAVEHGELLYMPDRPLAERVARRLERRMSARAMVTQVAVSDFMRGEAAKVPGGPPIAVIENGIELQRFDSAVSLQARHGHDHDCTFGCAARLTEGKGVMVLINAFARFRSRAGARLVIAGDGPERARLEALVRTLRLESLIEFRGVVDDMAAFWSECDVGVMPSVAPEAFGLSAVEAMAAGRPVIATRSGGPEGIVDDGSTGALVSPGDVASLAAAMVRYANDSGMRARHGSQGRVLCRTRYSIERCAREYAALFSSIEAKSETSVRGNDTAGSSAAAA